MAINFPASPTVGQVYTYSSRSWQWNGQGWQAYPGPASVGPTGPTGPAGTTGNTAVDSLTITTTNVFPALSHSYNGSGLFQLIVNGQVFVSAGSSPAFSVSGTIITWLSTVFSVNPGDVVFAMYSY